MPYLNYVIANAWLAGLLYWLPLSLCVVTYSIRTWKNYRKDRARVEEMQSAERDEKGFPLDEDGYRILYYPTDTIGSVIGRALVSIVPIGNLWAAAFDAGPDLFSGVIERIERVFNQPLVPKPEIRHD